MSDKCQVCGPNKQEAPIVLCSPCAMLDTPEVTADDLTDEMIWQLVKAAADERNAVLLGYCAVALRQKTSGGLRHAREVLCKVINASIGALNARAKAVR